MIDQSFHRLQHRKPGHHPLVVHEDEEAHPEDRIPPLNDEQSGSPANVTDSFYDEEEENRGIFSASKWYRYGIAGWKGRIEQIFDSQCARLMQQTGGLVN